jgi:hypothetical protein
MDCGVLCDDPFSEWRAVALVGVLVGVSCRCGSEARVLLDSNGVALSVYSLSDSSKPSSPSELLAVCTDAPSSEE